MNHRKVEAGRGAGWIRAGYELLVRNPGVFLTMALILAVGQAIPLVNLAMVVAGPALFGGFLFALREQDEGRPAELRHLFLAFQTPGKAGPLMLLCLPGVAAVLMIGVILFVWIGAAFMGYGMSGNTTGAAAWDAALGIGAIVAVVLVVAIAFALYALMFYAVPRVLFDAQAPGAALRQSLVATFANLGAMLVFGGLFWLMCVVGFAVTSIVPVLGWMAWGVAVTALAAACVYSGYKDVFGAAEPAPAP